MDRGFQLLKQSTFNNGKRYVALTKASSLEQLYVHDSFSTKAVRAKSQALEQYHRMCFENILVVSNVNST